MKILFAGCGDLGSRAAGLLLPEHICHGLRRHPKCFSAGLVSIAADMTSVEQMYQVLSAGYDVVIATITPQAFNEAAYKASYRAAANALKSTVDALVSPPSLIIWASSTSVYGDHLGDWVDEDSLTAADSFSGRILRQAEQTITRLSCPQIVVRFSGIYGPRRTRLLDQVRAGVGRPIDPIYWSNRIHIDDCAAVFSHLVKIHAAGGALQALYLASDNDPVGQHQLRSWLAERIGVSLKEQPTSQESSRRCSNNRLLDSGFRFSYPTFREGYSALL